MRLKKIKINESYINKLAKMAYKAVLMPRVPKDLGAKYGAAVLSINNEIYYGFNIFSSTHSLSLHAEQCAIVNAKINNDYLIKAIAISSDDASTLPLPCGICRQLLYENSRYSKIDILVIICNTSHVKKTYYLSELLPFPWPSRKPKNKIK